MTPDSPEIARLRKRLFGDKDDYLHEHPVTIVRREDLIYVLTLVDDSCKGCAFVEEIQKQGSRLDRMYALFDEVMRQHRVKRPWDEAPHVGDTQTAASGVVELRTCQHERCPREQCQVEPRP